jgi:nickel-type superoxide dismutase maturation protease
VTGAGNWPLVRVEVAEDSMRPTLLPGDWLIAWRSRRVRPGHVVLAWHPSRDGLLLVKRVARLTEHGWWLASDNPLAAGAADSSRFGPVPAELIVGRVLARYYPFGTVRLFPATPSPGEALGGCARARATACGRLRGRRGGPRRAPV